MIETYRVRSIILISGQYKSGLSKSDPTIGSTLHVGDDTNALNNPSCGVTVTGIGIYSCNL